MTPEYEPEEPLYSEVWMLVNTGPHRDCGGWTDEQGQPVCACGAVLCEPAEAAA